MKDRETDISQTDISHTDISQTDINQKGRKKREIEVKGDIK